MKDRKSPKLYVPVVWWQFNALAVIAFLFAGSFTQAKGSTLPMSYTTSLIIIFLFECLFLCDEISF